MTKDTKNEMTGTPQDLSNIKLVDFGESTGFTCDVQTGVCGPTTQKEEDDK